MPCSDPIIAMLAPFRPLFTAPTWKQMGILLRGTLLARGRRTVTAALWQTGQQQDPHFSTLHQVRQSRSLGSPGGASALPHPALADLGSGRRNAGWGDRRNAATALG